MKKPTITPTVVLLIGAIILSIVLLANLPEEKEVEPVDSYQLDNLADYHNGEINDGIIWTRR